MTATKPLLRHTSYHVTDNASGREEGWARNSCLSADTQEGEFSSAMAGVDDPRIRLHLGGPSVAFAVKWCYCEGARWRMKRIMQDASTFEAVHSDIAGKCLANLTALLLCSMMMLRQMNLNDHASKTEPAILSYVRIECLWTQSAYRPRAPIEQV
ncbi:hypothetical protein PENSPDRAFT_754131 [Peniophora sp. CONT]|nr:hypothetical protein PENSPDRAFT_754131 [Peniophora sp. CONT]